MNYKLHYDKLIHRAQNRSILKSEYKENHHIIPTCMDGSDDKENKVALFAEEHVIAHLLLVKIFPSEIKLVQAAHMMTNGCGNKLQERKVNNKKYAWLRKKNAIAVSLCHKGRKRSDATKKKMSIAATGRIMSQYTKDKLSGIKLNTPQKVKDQILETVKKWHKEVGVSEITKNKLSEKAKNQWKFNREKICATRQRERNSQFDTTFYEFQHKDGRVIVSYKADMRIMGIGVTPLINGNIKTSKGWKYTGRKFKRIEV